MEENQTLPPLGFPAKPRRQPSFFSSSSSSSSLAGSNPATPRLKSRSFSSPALRCRTSSSSNLNTSATTTAAADDSLALHCRTTHNTPRATTAKLAAASPKPKHGSNPASPRSPLKLSLFKNSFKFRKINRSSSNRHRRRHCCWFCSNRHTLRVGPGSSSSSCSSTNAGRCCSFRRRLISGASPISAESQGRKSRNNRHPQSSD